MSIFATLKSLIVTLSATIMAFLGSPTIAPILTPEPTPIAIEQIAPPAPDVVTQAVSTPTPTPAPTATPNPLVEAYELGKAIGKLEGQVETLEQIANATTPTPAPIQLTLTPTPMPEPTPAPSLASLGVFGIYDPNALVKEYEATPSADVEKGNYVQLGLIVKNDLGDAVKTPQVVITATDESQNKTLNGTGSYDKNREVFYYTYVYEFHTAGAHTITFSANGMTESVTLTAK